MCVRNEDVRGATLIFRLPTGRMVEFRAVPLLLMLSTLFAVLAARFRPLTEPGALPFPTLWLGTGDPTRLPLSDMN